MTAPVIELLDTTVHDRSSFDCGEPSLDEWLKRFAGQSAKTDGARTYVTAEDAVIVGYYSLSSSQVESAVVPKRLRSGGYPVPAVLLGRLAVDRARQGRGLGDALLLDALRVSAEAADQIGVRLMVVHALNPEAAGFYQYNGFERVDGDDRTLILPMQDIRATLEAAGLR